MFAKLSYMKKFSSLEDAVRFGRKKVYCTIKIGLLELIFHPDCVRVTFKEDFVGSIPLVGPGQADSFVVDWIERYADRVGFNLRKFGD